MSFAKGNRAALAYEGVRAPFPPNVSVEPRDPNTKDRKNFVLGDLWLNSVTQNVWMLFSLANATATWKLLGGSNDLLALKDNAGTIVNPDAAGQITFPDGANTNSVGNALANTMTINLDTSILQPSTTADGSSGVYALGSTDYTTDRFLHGFGTNNTFVGRQSGNLTLTANNCVAIGYQAAVSLDASLPLVAIGAQALENHAPGNLATGQNVAIGYRSMRASRSCHANVCIGSNAMSAATTTLNCVYIGNVAGQLSTGDKNTGIGSGALVDADGESNVAVGATALAINSFTGSNNIGIGHQAGTSLGAAAESNICINSVGTAADSNTLRIGAATGAGTRQLNKAFIHGIRGITTGVADAIAVLVDSAGQLGTVSSSIRYKENVERMGTDSKHIMKLRPVTFNYKSDVAKTKTFGLIAEEVKEHMPQLVVYDSAGEVLSVKYHELPVLLLNELQRMYTRVKDLEDEIDEIKDWLDM